MSPRCLAGDNTLSDAILAFLDLCPYLSCTSLMVSSFVLETAVRKADRRPNIKHYDEGFMHNMCVVGLYEQ